MTLTERAAVAVQTAMREWQLNVIDPPDSHIQYGRSRERIRAYIGEGLGWKADAERYEHDGQFAWCGAFVAYCYAQAGLKPELRLKHLASTYRLDRWLGGDTGRRRFSAGMAKPGDVLVVGHGKDQGDHIAIVEVVVSTVIHTIEGNASGNGPKGDWREGVIRRSRDIHETARLYRFVDADFDEVVA